MANLVIYQPSHGYANDDPLYVSWLDGVYYVADKTTNSFALATTAGGATYLRFTSTVTDGFVRKVSEPSATIDGLDHLEGETLTLVSGGESLGSFVVASGEVTAPRALASYQIGLPFRMQLRTTRFGIPGQGTETRIKNIIATTIRYLKSKGGFAGQEVDDTAYVDPLDATFSARSQDKKTLTRGGHSADGYTVIQSTPGLPMTVLATILDVEVTEK
jgi:hypothetical protein